MTPDVAQCVKPLPVRGVPCSSSVQHLETSSPSAPTWGSAHAWWHQRHHRARDRIWYAFWDSDDEAHEKRADKLANCCRGTQVFQRETGLPFVAPLRCRDRLCPLCSAARSREMRDRVVAAAGMMNASRFITLTAPSVDADLADQLSQLRAALASMRKQPSWREHVTGGIYTVQVTFSEQRGQWHPHIHLLVDGYFFAHHTLKSLWKQALSDATDLWADTVEDHCVVDIRIAHDRRATGRYIARYICNTDEVATWPRERIREYGDAIKGVRMMTTFGNLHGKRLAPKPVKLHEENPCFQFSMGYVHHLAEADAPGARAALRTLGMAIPIVRNLSRWCATGPPIDSEELIEVEARRAVETLRRLYIAGWSPPVTNAGDMGRGRTKRITEEATGLGDILQPQSHR